MQLWTIVDLTSGAVLAAAFPTPSTGSHPKDNGWAWNAPTQKATRIDAVPDLASQVWTGAIWTDDLTKIDVALIGQVKAEAERRRMLVLSPGGSKKTVYSLKQAEVDEWNDLASTLATALTGFLGLPAIKQRRKFRFAMAEAALRGETSPVAAIARFAAGSDASNTEAARIEAIEQAGVVAIKAAATVAAKRAAHTAIDWSWKPTA